MNKKIAVLSGDGIGPEVMRQTLRVLEAVARLYGHQFDYVSALVGACAIEDTGEPLPQQTANSCLEADAVLFGAIGHPKYDNDPDARVRPEQGLLQLRKSLGLYANIRPVLIFPGLEHLSPLKSEILEGVDLVIYRELTGGIYFGERGRDEATGAAYDTCWYTAEEVVRVARFAFVAAQRRKRKLTLVDKANVLDSSRLWRATVRQLAVEYPDVILDFMFVDNAAMQLIRNPACFDVILTGNMFGDILSDEASVLPGSMGLLPSASIGDRYALFEPIHGSWPQAAGKDTANPFAMMLSAAMMLDHFGAYDEAEHIRHAIYTCLSHGIGTADLQTGICLSCSEIGELIASFILEGTQVFDKAKVLGSVSAIN